MRAPDKAGVFPAKQKEGATRVTPRFPSRARTVRAFCIYSGAMADHQLTISQLRAELERIQAEHGDLPVVLDDADTNWLFRLKAGHLDVRDGRLCIGCRYSDEKDNS